MRSSRNRLVMAFALALALAAPLFAQTSIQEADAAFNNGSHDQALDLYDQVLEDDPDNLRALIQSAKLLSWEKRYDEAISRYGRALTIEPQNETARMERAKVLSWSGHFTEAGEAFRAIVEDEPENLDARLGLARVLSWSGNQLAARTEYQEILDIDSENAAAKIGIAQTFAWSGEGAEARHWYDSVLASEPEQRSAILGTAYLDLWAGDRYQASQKVAQLIERFPNDDEVQQLQQAIRRELAPAFEANSSYIEDTDNNEVAQYGVEAAFAFPHRMDLTAGIDRYELRNNLSQQEGTVSSGYLSVLLRPVANQRLSLRAGVDVAERTEGDSETEPVGNLLYTIGVGGKIETTFQAERRTLRYTTRSLDQGIIVDAYSGRVLFKPRPSIRISGGAGLWNFSDGNDRPSYDAGIAYRWPVRSWRIDSNYFYRSFDYEHDLNNGYFDPQNFRSHSVALTIQRDFGSRLYATGNVETGLQSFEFGAIEVSDDQYLVSSLMIGIHLTPGVALEVHGVTGDYALQNASGFESDQISARLRWQLHR